MSLSRATGIPARRARALAAICAPYLLISWAAGARAQDAAPEPAPNASPQSPDQAGGDAEADSAEASGSAGASGSAEASGEGEAQIQTRYDENLDHAARLTFQNAREAFLAGEYELALERFRQAYNLSPRPMLLYNIAATLDRLRRDEETVEALKAYLDAAPQATDRREVEARIRVLERAIEERGGSTTETGTQTGTETGTETGTQTGTGTETGVGAGTGTGAPVEEESGGLHPAIVLAVAGAALVAGGLIVWSGLDASGQGDDLKNFNSGTAADAQDLYDGAQGAEVRTNALIGVAAGLGAAAVVLAIFTDWDALTGGDDESAPTASVGIDPRGGATAMVRGTF